MAEDGAIKLRLTSTVMLVLGCLLIAAVPASASVTVGQLLSPSTPCTADSIDLQTGVSSGAGYTIPSDGVITSWDFQVGSAPVTQLALVVATPAVAGSRTIVAESAAGTQTAAVVSQNLVRIPVTAGDVIGIFYGGGGTCFSSGHTGEDTVDVHSPGLNVGDSAMFAQLTANRVPLTATVEPDADHDGYGDESQDSCPSETSVHFGPCSTGSMRIGQTFEPSGACDQGTYVQAGVSGGTTYTTPAAGVLTSWSVQAPAAPNADPMAFKVLRPTGAPHTYTVIGESPLEHVAGGSGIVSFPARVLVAPGDVLGLYSDGNQGWCGSHPLGATDFADVLNMTNSPFGSTTSYASMAPLFRSDIEASLEPDRDGDGFGDLTQDACPTDPTRQTACPAPARAASLSAVGQSASRWREGRAPARLSRKHKRPPVGTTFRFTLDRAAAVRLVFTQKRPGRRMGKKCVAPTKVNKAKRKCTRTVTAGKLSFANGHAGANKVRFAGRLSKTRRLRPGSYTLTITATNGPGLASAPKRLRFTIVK